MKIELHNFKCYKDQTFEFNTVNGIVLLSGDSGKGKSTILQAIYFALYGKITKVISYGDKTCSVCLTLPKFTIKRSKGPNKLIVNHLLHDDEAQQFINSHFGTQFEFTGYIPQTISKSFIMMSGSEKLSLLETFTHSTFDIVTVKLKCKNNISRLNDEMMACQGKIETCNEMIASTSVRDPLECPIQGVDCVADAQLVYDNEVILSMQTQKVMQRLINELGALNNLDSLIKTYDDQKTDLNDQLLSLRMVDLSMTDADESSLAEARAYLADYLNMHELTAQLLENDRLSTQLDTLKQKELSMYESKLAKYSARLWSKYSEEDFYEIKQSIEAGITDVTDLRKIQTKLDDVMNDTHLRTYNTFTIDELRAELELQKNNLMSSENEKHAYTCPECNTCLTLKDEKLIVNNNTTADQGDTHDDIEIINKTINALYSIIDYKIRAHNITDRYEEMPYLGDLTVDLKLLSTYEFKQLDMINKIADLEHCLATQTVQSDIYASLMDDYERTQRLVIDLRKKTPEFEYDNKFGESELEISNTISSIERHLHDQKRVSRGIRDISSRLVKIDGDISRKEQGHVDRYGSINQVIVIEREIDDCRHTIIDIEKNTRQYLVNLSGMSTWVQHMKEYNSFMEWTTKLNGLCALEKTLRCEYEASLKLKEILLNCESRTVANLVDTINIHAKLYIDAFFSDDINVSLSPYKSTKSGVKPEVSISIEYKGMECDLLMLSGGEVARIVLAFTLALNEIFETPILLLDECTSSLDEETAGDVFNVIKEQLHGVFTIVVAHQAVTGVFDEIVEL